MADSLVSIVIPCYKQAHWIPQAVQSCLEQSHPDIEIIVVNDGSPDDLSRVIRQFGDNIRLIEQENKGLSAARNAGLNEARGKFVKFLDSDDWLLPNCIKLQYNALQGLNKFICVIGCRYYYENSPRLNKDFYPNFDRFCNALVYNNIAPVHSYLFKTQDIRDIGGFNTGSIVDGGHEDYELVCRLAIEGYEAVSIHSIGCVYRQTSNSMSKQVGQMRCTRGAVWAEYSHRLSDLTTSPDVLSHVLGGFCAMLKMREVGYESTKLLQKIADKLSSMALEMRFSTTTVLRICKDLIDLLSWLPQPHSRHDRKQHNLCLNISNNLTDIVLRYGKSDNALDTLTFVKLSIAHMRQGNFRQSRRVNKCAKTIPSNDSALKIALLTCQFISTGLSIFSDRVIYKFLYKDAFKNRTIKIRHN